MQNQMLTWFVRILVMFTAFPVHEYAHGYIARRLGDPTAERQGRLTFNPFAHLDPIGSAMLVLFGFGWAKSVPVDPRYFRNPKRDMAFTALAGPISNVLLALVVMILSKLLLGFGAIIPSALNNAAAMVYLIFSIIIQTNLYLAVFNLLPVPPLDGSRILGAVLPDRQYYFLMQNERYFYIVMILLLATGMLSGPLRILANAVYFLLDKLTFPLDLLMMGTFF